MSDMAATNGQQAAPMLPGVLVPGDVEAVRNAQLDGALVLAKKAAGATSGAEAKDFAQASMSLAQAVVVLDPSLDQQGVPLRHQVELESVRQDGQERLEKAKQAAGKPAPAKRKLKVKRDGGGNVTSYEED